MHRIKKVQEIRLNLQKLRVPKKIVRVIKKMLIIRGYSENEPTYLFTKKQIDVDKNVSELFS